MFEDNNEEVTFDLPDEIKEAIETKVRELRKGGLKRVYPIVVEGDEFDEKDLYIGYFKKPTAMNISKFQTMSKKGAFEALRGLAKDSFIEGDKELINDDDLFTYGLQPQIGEILESRRGKIVNLSKPGK